MCLIKISNIIKVNIRFLIINYIQRQTNRFRRTNRFHRLKVGPLSRARTGRLLVPNIIPKMIDRVTSRRDGQVRMIPDFFSIGIVIPKVPVLLA
jgi:hypothetical protein